MRIAKLEWKFLYAGKLLTRKTNDKKVPKIQKVANKISKAATQISCFHIDVECFILHSSQ